jgi:hypothetical protein
MIDFCFVNVSFGERYVNTQKRLRDSILAIYPDATLFFWTNELPPGSRSFHESLYGFKVHAVKYAIEKGFKKVVWIDTCAVLKAPIEPLFDAGFIAVKDDNKLYKFSGYQTIKNKEWNLVGGSLYLFNFFSPKDHIVFSEWAKHEAAGLFGDQAFIMNENNDGIERCGHRMDETCMALCLYENGYEPHTMELYQTIIEKKHFLADGEKWYNK